MRPARWTRRLAVPADPALADAEPGNVTDASIDRKHFSMIAIEPSERVVEAKGIERPDFYTGTTEPPEKTVRGIAERPNPVVEQTDLHAFTGFFRKQRRERLAHIVCVNDVTLEVNPFACGAYGLLPRRVILGRILQQAHTIPQDQRRAGRAGESFDGWYVQRAGPHTFLSELQAG